jgi:type I restriction enzyme S subunit
MIDFPWPICNVGDSLQPLIRLPFRKLNTNEYREAGKYPVVDQGQGLIAGWTDDPSAVITDPLPLIVFGDHTRLFKFVDFPFARGADGTQLLKPRAGIDPLFFFYACRSIDLPSRGYNRHFSILKEKTIPVPEEESEQHHIATVLRRLETSAKDHVDELRTLDELKRATMRELFTRGLRSESLKESEIGLIPTSWCFKPLTSVCHMESGGTPPKSDIAHWTGTHPWVSGKDLKVNRLADSADHISEEAARTYSKIAPAGAVLVLVRGMGLAKGFALSLIERPMAFNQDLKALIPNGQVDGPFLMHALTYAGQRMLQNVSAAAHGTKRLGQNDLDQFMIPIPSPDEQSEISAILDAIDQKIDLHKQKKAVLEDLFRTLLHKLMAGEVRVSDLDLSALETAPAVEVTV